MNASGKAEVGSDYSVPVAERGMVLRERVGNGDAFSDAACTALQKRGI